MVPMVTALMESAAQAVKAEIGKSYKDAMQNSQPNTPATANWKRYWYFMSPGSIFPLYASGNLKSAMDNIETKIYPFGASKIAAEIGISLPEAGEEGFVPGRKDTRRIYLWSHEFGVNWSSKMHKFGIKEWKHFRIPKRPFMGKGIQNGLRAAQGIIANGMGFYRDKWANGAFAGRGIVYG